MDLDRSETGSHHDIIVGKVVNLIYIYILLDMAPSQDSSGK